MGNTCFSPASRMSFVVSFCSLKKAWPCKQAEHLCMCCFVLRVAFSNSPTPTILHTVPTPKTWFWGSLFCFACSNCGLSVVVILRSSVCVWGRQTGRDTMGCRAHCFGWLPCGASSGTAGAAVLSVLVPLGMGTDQQPSCSLFPTLHPAFQLSSIRWHVAVKCTDEICASVSIPVRQCKWQNCDFVCVLQSLLYAKNGTTVHLYLVAKRCSCLLVITGLLGKIKFRIKLFWFCYHVLKYRYI